jgi:hypothetical protein
MQRPFVMMRAVLITRLLALLFILVEVASLVAAAQGW